jgi:inhibitor of cysteine peptidase
MACLLVVVFAGLAACSATEPIVVNLGNSGATAVISAGDLLDARLESNPTTGYGWEVVDVDESILEQQEEPDYVASQGEPLPVMGAGGYQVFHFKANQAGETTLKMVYRRSWETGVEPIHTFELTVVVE